MSWLFEKLRIILFGYRVEKICSKYKICHRNEERKKWMNLSSSYHGARPKEPRCVHRDVFDEENGQGDMFEFLELVN